MSDDIPNDSAPKNQWFECSWCGVRYVFWDPGIYNCCPECWGRWCFDVGTRLRQIRDEYLRKPWVSERVH